MTRVDVRHGHIYTATTAERLIALDALAAQHLKPMAVAPTAEQLARGRVGRNDRCPCGSGRKYKACHLRAAEHPRRNPTGERLYAQALAADEIASEPRKPLPVVRAAE